MFVRLALLAVALVLALGLLARSSEGAARERTYRVQPGDTLWSIAAGHYGGDTREGVWELTHRNGLETSVLQPGQSLVLP